MKKRGQYKTRLLLIGAMMAVVFVFGWVTSGGLGITKGPCIKTAEEDCIIVMADSPVKMINSTNRKRPFKKYSTGDEILIIHGAVMESYPGQTQVHWAIKLSGGDKDNVPQDILADLAGMGWNIVYE